MSIKVDIDYYMSDVENPQSKSYLRTALRSNLINQCKHEPKEVDRFLDRYFNKFSVGDNVIWTDPDGGHQIEGKVSHINGEVITLNDETEVFEHEIVSSN